MYTGPEKAYYTIKYTTKHQQDLENPWALHLHAFDKANRVLSNETDTQAAAGRRRIQNMCCTLSIPHKVSAPMACLYVIKGTVMYSSHEFVKLPLPTVLKALFQQDEQLDIVLEDVRRSNLPKDELLRYQQSVMALFRPFRCGTDFDTNGETFGAFFEQWWATKAPTSARTFVKNNTDYYGSRELLQSHDDPEAARYLRYEAGLDDDREIDSTGFDMQDADEDDGGSDESEPEDMDEIVWAPTQPTKYIKDLEKSTDCVDLAAASTLADTMVTNISMSLEHVEQKLHCLVAPESHLRSGTCASTL
ncbi:hypothetical protein GN244_ATG17491 [Phytophthora infestans]|uniref:Uncharacterized protein n=1 Tax=Phytophthora infestans TaxID=4787 RepID=A0A833SJA4_PHYIN|nr:hypothetical protein GN244_ATG17491 [Phytophthora infestans]